MKPPADWQPPPRDRVADVIRSARVAGSFLSAMALDLARSRISGDSTTADGLARIRERCAHLLDAIGVAVDVRHIDRAPASGGLVFMWNQTSHLDHVLLPLAIPRPFHTTYNNEVRRFPIYGRYLAKTDHFWLDRNDEAQWREQLARAARRIQDGACVLVSPEGTRSWDGRLLPMKRGAFLLVRAAARPIVCVTLSGARERLPRGRLGIKPGRVTIELSEPIPADTPDLEGAVVQTFQRAMIV